MGQETMQTTAEQYQLPEDHKPFADKYFLRTKEILQAEGLNPWIKAQVFVRKGPGVVAGMDEALKIIDTYSPLVEHGGRVWVKPEGSLYQPKDTLMVIEGPVQDIVELETMYLGVLAAEITKANDGTGVDPDLVTRRMREVVREAKGKPVSYFGARHWRYDEDAMITQAAYNGGAVSASTDAGAATFGQKGMGTIPHALENVMAWKYGYDNAVKEATLAFDRNIDPEIPRIALIDYANREIQDSIATADALQGNLYAVRVDTCGENIAEGATPGDKSFWEGNGVTITGVKALREGLDRAGHNDVKIILTSGFGNPEKVKAFVEAEEELGIELFDALGVGGVYDSRATTMDIVAVGETPQTMEPFAKVGRGFNPNISLELALGQAEVDLIKR